MTSRRATPRQGSHVYLARNLGDFGLEPVPERTETVILGKDEPATDQVKALGESIAALWQQRDNWDQMAGFSREDSIPYVPAEPDAASLLQTPKYMCYGVKVDAGYDEFGDGCRVFVWRNSQWHPVSAQQLEQIKTNLSDGSRVFQVSDGTLSWTVDARKKNEWVQLSPAGTRRALRCTPTILHHEDTNIDFLDKIKAEWKDIVGDEPQMKFDDLMSAFRKKSCKDDEELLYHVADDIFRRVDFTSLFPVTFNKWIHYRLLEAQAPSLHAIDQINQRLSAWMVRYRQLLSRFIELFMQSCEDTSSMRLTTSQMKCAVRTWFSQTSNDMFTPDYKEHLDNLLSGDSAFEEGEYITYYEFLNYMTGQSWHSVELYYYDLTKGSAWWWTPVLFGRQMPCLWHCGIVVFGKEYRYGGNIFESTPGATAFGTPQKMEKIGTTCRSRQDVLSFINRSLAHQFAVDSYQVLSNNSNHFCDMLSLFLTNEHISAEVLQQPEDIMRSRVAQSLNTWMPWLKGTPLKRTRVSVKAQKEWDTVDSRVFVNYEYEDGWTTVARVVKQHEHSCDLSWYNRQDCQFHVIRGVSREAVQPLFGVGNPLQSLCLPQRKF